MRTVIFFAFLLTATATLAQERDPRWTKMCWQDYCPCQESRPLDKMLCRNLRGGAEVTVGMMASGAASRDANDALEQWQRDNPGY